MVDITVQGAYNKIDRAHHAEVLCTCGPRWDFLYPKEVKLMEPLKNPLSYQEQITHLQKKHGLTIANLDEALLILKKVNYYRLSAYGIGLKDSKNPEMYLPGISLEHLYRLYAFDAHLRTLLIPVIEELEIELRTKIAYHLAMTYGSEGYRDPNHFLSLNNKFGESIHAKTMEKLDKEIFSQRTIPFVLHHQKKYGGRFPIWVAVELFSFGMLSSIFTLMLPEDKAVVAANYHTDAYHLKSWILALVEIRNTCAHYGRIYNMPFKQTPTLYKEHRPYQSNRLFSILLVLKRMTQGDVAWRNFKASLIGLIESYPEANLFTMGFPENWKDVLA